MSVVWNSRVLLATSLLTAGSGVLAAQGPVPGAQLDQVSTRCLVGSAALRTATGGILGGWVGFVAGKIRVSDWNEAAHTPEGHRAVNRAAMTGAAIGAVVGAIVHVGKPCGGATAVQRARLGREPLYVSEITKAGVTGTVYDALRTLRPNWLNLRGVQALTEGAETFTFADGQSVTLTGAPRLTVYLDNAKLGSIDELRTLAVIGITSVRYYEPAEATMRWGAGNTHGAIQVLTSEP